MGVEDVAKRVYAKQVESNSRTPHEKYVRFYLLLPSTIALTVF